MTERTFDGVNEFRIGNVFIHSFSVFGKDILVYWTITALIASPTLLTSLRLVTFGTPQALGAQRWAISFLEMSMANVGLATFLSLFTNCAVLFIAFQKMGGRPIGFGDVLRRMSVRMLPLIGTVFCVGFLVSIASLLLIVPGLIVLTMLYVAVPVSVVEDRGPFGAVRRSAELTKGHRWSVFAMLLAFGIVAAVFNFTITAVLTRMAGAVAAIVVNFPVSMLIAAFGHILSIVTYHDLRLAREGVDTDRIAAVFD